MTSKTQAPERPLSPFMLGQYYRFQLTSLLSFVHRMTGIGLAAGLVPLAWWLLALADGRAAYDAFAQHLQAWYGQALLFAWSWALVYHLCNGIRHLVWDVGRAYSMRAVYLGGYIVVAASLVITGAAWALARFA